MEGERGNVGGVALKGGDLTEGREGKSRHTVSRAIEQAQTRSATHWAGVGGILDVVEPGMTRARGSVGTRRERRGAVSSVGSETEERELDTVPSRTAESARAVQSEPDCPDHSEHAEQSRSSTVHPAGVERGPRRARAEGGRAAELTHFTELWPATASTFLSGEIAKRVTCFCRHI